MYLRVARTDEDDTALKAQKAACEEYIARHGLTAVGVYTDYGPAPKGALPAALRQLCDAAVKSREITFVVTASPDRLGRLPVRFERSKAALTEAGLAIRYATGTPDPDAPTLAVLTSMIDAKTQDDRTPLDGAC